MTTNSSSEMAVVADERDVPNIPSGVIYRPAPIKGRRYLVVPQRPEPRQA